MSADSRAAGALLADQGVDVALAALAAGTMRNGPLILALQWLALNRGRLRDIVRAGSAVS